MTERETERPSGSAGGPSGAPLPASRGEADEGKYVYCIIRSSDERDFGTIGIGEGEHPAYTVHHGDLAAVVSDTPIRIYDPTRENVLAHEFVRR